jgi:hypothetical protein
LRYFLGPGVRRLLAAEIAAQFEAFRATGLALDHVNAHQHLHLHPTVARLIVAIGPSYGMRAVRLPAEPTAALRRAFPGERYRTPAYRPVVAALRRRLRRAGLVSNDHVFGIAWSGAMVEERVLGLLPHLPPGVSEIYFHPATRNPAPPCDAGLPPYRVLPPLSADVAAGSTNSTALSAAGIPRRPTPRPLRRAARTPVAPVVPQGASARPGRAGLAG